MKGIVYKICLSDTTNNYIGSTIHFSTRKTEHLRDLKKGTHHCIFLQRYYSKYIPEITFEILYEGIDYLEKEQFYLDTITNKFNTSKSASAPMLGLTHTKEVREAMSIRLTLNNPNPKGVKRSKEFCDSMKGTNLGKKRSKKSIDSQKLNMPNKKAVVYDDKFYISIASLADELKVHRNNISRTFVKKRTTYKGKSISLLINKEI